MAGLEDGNKLEKLQVVAKKLERMLETTLGQLKLEQKMRKEAQDRTQAGEKMLLEANRTLAVLEATAKRREAELEATAKRREAELEAALGDKEAKILNLEASVEYLQETVVSRVEAARRKDDMIRKLRSMIDLYNPPKPKPLKKKPASPEKTPLSPEKVSFNNTAFIDIVPVVKAQSAKTPNMLDMAELKQSDMKTETEEAVEADHIVIDTIYAPDVADDDVDDKYQDIGLENDIDDPGEEQEEEARVVKLEPRDEKTLASDRLKDIKHKTKCRVCQEEFQNRQALLEHEKESGHYYKFSCRLCGKSFRQKIQVKRHEAQLHSAATPFKCSRCERTFKSEFSWKRHQANDEVHEKMETYTPFLNCEVCGKQFERRRRWCLDQHMLTHTAEKKFHCDICGNNFRNSSYLTTHKKACSGIKEEECAFCGKKFAKRVVLMNHERLHTGETPYNCRICGQSFRTHHAYTIHGKSMHKAISAKHFHLLQDKVEAESETVKT